MLKSFLKGLFFDAKSSSKILAPSPMQYLRLVNKIQLKRIYSYKTFLAITLGFGIYNYKSQTVSLQEVDDLSVQSLSQRLNELAKIGGENQRAVSVIYIDLGHALAYIGKYEEGVKCFEKALDIIANLYTKNSTEYLRVVSLVFDGWLWIKQPQKSEQLLLEGIEIASKMFESSYNYLADFHKELAKVYSKNREYEKSISQYVKAAEVYEKLGEEFVEGRIDCLLYIAEVYSFSNNLIKAKEYLAKAYDESVKELGLNDTLSKEIYDEIKKIERYM